MTCSTVRRDVCLEVNGVVGAEKEVCTADQKKVAPVHHDVADVTPWTLLSKLEISLLMLVTVLSAAAITFCDSVLAPFLQVTPTPHFLSPKAFTPWG